MNKFVSLLPGSWKIGISYLPSACFFTLRKKTLKYVGMLQFTWCKHGIHFVYVLFLNWWFAKKTIYGCTTENNLGLRYTGNVVVGPEWTKKKTKTLIFSNAKVICLNIFDRYSIMVCHSPLNRKRILFVFENGNINSTFYSFVENVFSVRIHSIWTVLKLFWGVLYWEKYSHLIVWVY